MTTAETDARLTWRAARYQARSIQQIYKICCDVDERSIDRQHIPGVTRLVDESFTFNVAAAPSAPHLAGASETIPFAFARDGKFFSNSMSG